MNYDFNDIEASYIYGLIKRQYNAEKLSIDQGVMKPNTSFKLHKNILEKMECVNPPLKTKVYQNL